MINSSLSENIIAWTKSHKALITNHIITEHNYISSPQPTAIFMAGLPGAGKTEFLNRIKISDTDFVNIDLDQLVENISEYSPKNYYLYRNAANLLVESLLDKVINKHLNFALDGTFAHNQALKNIKRALDHNFHVHIFFIYISAQQAWHNVKMRETLTHRPIDRKGFASTSRNLIPILQKALEEYQDHPRFNMTIIYKRPHSFPAYSYISDISEIDKLLKQIYNEYKEEK